MKLEDRIEKLYLVIWRTIVLGIATAALIAAVLASAAAVNGLLASAPYPPAEVKPDASRQALHQALTLDRFRLTQARASLPWQGDSASHSGGEFAYSDAVQRIAGNLDTYVKSAFPPVIPVPEATQWNVRHLMNSLEFKDDTELQVYLGTLEALTAQLATSGPEQALLPEERRIDPHRVLNWHAERTQRAFKDMGQENARLRKVYQDRLAAYAHDQARTGSFIAVAAGAAAIFVLAIFLFVIVRIERDLRTMAAASLATANQLNA